MTASSRGGEHVALAASLEGPPGAPVLVLGNSLGTSAHLWDQQVPALMTRFRVLRYEHRGHGPPGGAFSPAPAGPYSIGDLGGDVVALLDSYGLERVLYCGLSLGGMIGMWLAATFPDRIARLALCCTSAYLPPATMWTERAALVRAEGPAAVAARLVSRWFTPAFTAAEPDVPAAFATELGGMVPDGYAGCCEAIAAMDLRAMLPAIAAPTVVIAGEEDPATPPWQGAAIASGIPDARLAVVRGASHLACVSNPGQVTAALVDHLTG
jgi:3-oxoadipate enol-lactonase